MCAAPTQVTQANSAVIDSLKLVHDRQRLSGTLPVAGFVRLAEDLQSTAGNLDYSVASDVDRQDRPLLRLRVSGTLQLQCQRCLEAFEYGIAIDTALRLVAAAALASEQDDDPNEPDCIAASATFDLAALIEDEVLLALPTPILFVQGTRDPLGPLDLLEAVRSKMTAPNLMACVSSGGT